MATSVPQKPSTACLFIKVPIEVCSFLPVGLARINLLTASQLHQHIASNFDNDDDIKLYRTLCRVSAQAIDADGCSFWRRRFLRVFEMPHWQLTGHRLTDNEKFRDAYKRRKHTLQVGAKFKNGTGSKEKVCLEILRDLVVGKFIPIRRWHSYWFTRLDG